MGRIEMRQEVSTEGLGASRSYNQGVSPWVFIIKITPFYLILGIAIGKESSLYWNGVLFISEHTTANFCGALGQVQAVLHSQGLC